MRLAVSRGAWGTVIAIALTACAAEPSTRALEGWERAAAPHPDAPSPDTVPEGLRWVAVDGSDLLLPTAERAMWMRARTRCDASWRDPIVLAPKVYVGLDAYVAGQRVGPRRSYRFASGTPFYAVPIACDAHVVFRVTSRYTQIGFPEPPLTGEHAALIASLFARDAVRIVLAIVFLVIGLSGAILSLGTNDRRALLGLALYGVSLALWTLFHTRSKQLWLPTMELWFAAWWISVPATGAGVSLFVEGLFGPGPRGGIRLVRIALLVVTVGAALSLSLDDDAFHAVAAPIFVAGRGTILVGVILVVVHVARLARRGDRAALGFLVGLSVAFAAVLRDIAVSLGWLDGPDTWTQYGYAGFGVLLVALLRHRVAEVQRQRAEYAESLERFVRERELLARDLHDGIGGIVTNVRMLAERGADDPERGVLATISALAADGISELRTLVSGFDALPPSWREVAADLRRAGALMIDAHPIEHAFTAEVADDAPRPDVATLLQLTRVHREAITNAIKHADADAIRIQLAVSSRDVVLTVHDDGRGWRGEADGRGPDLGPDLGPHLGNDLGIDLGVDLGKGLTSMRARAATAGGALEIEDDDGVRVRLRLPFAPQGTSDGIDRTT